MDMNVAGTVPNDMWICGNCKGGNLVALAKDRCPVCDHQRDSCCKGPGAAYGWTWSGYENHPSYNPGAQSVDSIPHPYAPSPFATFDDGHMSYGVTPGLIELAGAGSPAPGSWICQNCGTANSSLTPDFCPACGAGR